MGTSESSVRITSLGTLFKIGSLAAVIYILLKRYKRKRTDNQTEQQVAVQPYKHGFSTEKRTSSRRVEIESSTPSESVSRIILKGPVVESSQASMITIQDTTSDTISDTTSKSNASPGDRHSIRKSPAQILADLKDPETMQALDDTISSTISAYESDRPKELDQENDELKKELEAIEAIECMASEGNPKAMNLLFKHVQSENFYVRHEAIRGILLYGGKDDRALLQETLPAGDWYIMDIRPEDMRKVC